MKIIFAGTPAFAVPSLLALLDRSDSTVVAVYTQPDKPAGRGQVLRESEIKLVARSRELTIEQPASLRDANAIARFETYNCDLLVVAAFGQILPATLLAMPRLGALNVHASLLPRWRGAAPIQRALMAGDQETGITIMRIVERLDAGPMLIKHVVKITDDDTAGSLHDRLSNAGGAALTSAIDALQSGTLPEEPQDEAQASYAKKIERDDRPLTWTRRAEELDRQVRALSPAPLATAELAGMAVSVVAARPLYMAHTQAPGSIIASGDEGIVVACASNALQITRLQPAGKRAMDAKEFLNGYRRQLNL